VSHYVPPVESGYAWTMVGVPIVGALIPIVFPVVAVEVAGLVCVALNVVLAREDDKRIQAAGYAGVSPGWALLVPLYLIVRAKRLSAPLIPMAWLVAFLVAATGTVLLGPVTMDSAKMDGLLSSDIQQQYGGGTVSVDCPSDPTVRVNGSFTCDVGQGGTTAHVVVTVTDHDGHYRWELVR